MHVHLARPGSGHQGRQRDLVFVFTATTPTLSRPVA